MSRMYRIAIVVVLLISGSALAAGPMQRTGLRAAISDSYSGMRWFESPGWVRGSLILTRLENEIAAEQFAYEFKGEAMQIDWSVARGGAMKLGDTILCRRNS
jgi:hypothetical protein